ncbi:TetR/AcrR family transcriptional regulator [Leifsonia naganoensis]|uniref:AcrR family transcriptional regulator n=1 Tax=Leifsonia naganoensis TaxID=150025 RepID=A0A853DNJ8_9MICO|nr:TetR/AcrR family transcriptional regulator C-terminal domain-containing protein [Leifsonia naganoensis]NYK09193.1 AcrR family transcriptional regulator [Leifsonia naganoensis]
MTRTPAAEPASAGALRGPGKRAGLTLEQILAAARTIDPRSLTMQAVADTLGVDRKAVHHYVRDRETLLDLVAREAFAEHFAAAHLAESESWQQACRAYATAFTESLIAIGSLGDYFRPGSPLLVGIIAPTEVLLSALLDAGFDDETAAQCLMLLTFICTGFARTATLTSEAGEHLGLAQLRLALEDSAGASFPHVTHMGDPSVDTSGAGQFRTSIDVFISGCEDLLKAQKSVGEP